MPLNVRRYCTSVLLVFVGFIVISRAQTPPPSPTPLPQLPTSGDVMRERVSKAKAFIAVRNYNAAIYELENIRRETSDPTVQEVVSVLLMNSYLEQSDFKRAQDFLNDSYAQQKTTRANAPALYIAVAGQVVRSARSRADRYRALGLSVADRTLPLEASTDLEHMRETLELVIQQSKEIAKDPKRSADAMALIEEASNSRGMLARDDYDAHRWKDTVADTREELANSRSVVLNAVTETPTGDGPATQQAGSGMTQPTNIPPVKQPVTQPVMLPVGQSTAENKPPVVRDREVKPADPPVDNNKPADSSVAKNDRPVFQPVVPPKVTPEKKEQPQPQSTPAPAAADGPKDTSPLDVGSLLAYATSESQPVYPAMAKNTRISGIVKVEVTVDERGEVTEVQKTSGPLMLQNAAKDAIRKWRFRPFVRDGQPVRAVGFVSFNFAL